MKDNWRETVERPDPEDPTIDRGPFMAALLEDSPPIDANPPLAVAWFEDPGETANQEPNAKKRRGHEGYDHEMLRAPPCQKAVWNRQQNTDECVYDVQHESPLFLKVESAFFEPHELNKSFLRLTHFNRFVNKYALSGHTPCKGG